MVGGPAVVLNAHLLKKIGLSSEIPSSLKSALSEVETPYTEDDADITTDNDTASDSSLSVDNYQESSYDSALFIADLGELQRQYTQVSLKPSTCQGRMPACLHR
jgi:hypothetical protein